MIVLDDKISEVAHAVESGLSARPKRLPSWLFYDENGDKLFQRIMSMPEYYLTPCEYEILEANKQTLLELVSSGGAPFNLVELGAGDGLKTEVLLSHFTAQNAELTYTPVDVSENILNALKHRLSITVPDLRVNPINSSYDRALDRIPSAGPRKVLLFLGANIGNLTIRKARDFLAGICKRMSPGDQLLVGFDLRKDPRLIIAAYDDPQGITRDFNLNLLHRLNRELGADFDVQSFSHFPCYDPETGMASSHIVSRKDQDVYFEACDLPVHFHQWEALHTEVSQKYDRTMIEALAAAANLEITGAFYDRRRYFCDVLMKKRQPA